VRIVRTAEGTVWGSITYPDYEYYRDHTRVFSGFAAYDGSATPFMVRAGEEQMQVDGGFATGNLFAVLGLAPAAGRFFVPDEDTRGSTAQVAVISWALAHQLFDGAERAVGQPVVLNGRRFTVIGVTPERFRGVGVADTRRDIWLPVWTRPQVLGRSIADMVRTPNHVHAFLVGIGRLAPGVTVDAARANLGALAAQLAQSYADNARAGVAVLTHFALGATARASVITVVRLLFGVAGVVLLIACANLANLLLARGAARTKEIGIRLAVGASRAQVVRQLLAESALLALVGGAAGVLAAAWTVDAIAALMPVRATDGVLTMDGRVLAFALVLSLATVLAFGVIPALRAARTDIAPVLGAAQGRSTGRSRTRSALVVLQVALSFVLLVGAGLFVRSLRRITGTELGFDHANTLVVSLGLRAHGYTDSSGARFYRALLDRARTIPGVSSATYGSVVPLSGASRMGGVVGEGSALTLPPGETMFDTYENVVAPDYFRTLGTPLVAGREFTERDDASAPRVVIVNETFARRFWPGGNAVGRRIRTEETGPWMEVVGVVRDAAYEEVGETPHAVLYEPLYQRYDPRMKLFLRAAGEAAALAEPARAAVRAIDPNLPVADVRLFSDVFDQSVLRYRTNATLVTLFGALAVVLAAVGLYGVISFVVAQGTREIGVRVALGASRRDVLRHVVGGGMALALAGMALGAAGALAASRLVAGLLFGVTPTDPTSFIAVATVLAAVSLVASWLPAARAARVDPMVALRSE
jgi:predicted permease